MVLKNKLRQIRKLIHVIYILITNKKKNPNNTRAEMGSPSYELTKTKRRFKAGRCPTCAEPGCNAKTCILTPYCSEHTKAHYGVQLKKVVRPEKTRTMGLFYMNKKPLSKDTLLLLPYSGTKYPKLKRKRGVKRDTKRKEIAKEIAKINRRIRFVSFDFEHEKYVDSSDVRNYPARYIRIAGKNDKPNIKLDAVKGFGNTSKPSIIQGHRFRLKTLSEIKTGTELILRPFNRAQLLSVGLYVSRKKKPTVSAKKMVKRKQKPTKTKTGKNLKSKQRKARLKKIKRKSRQRMKNLKTLNEKIKNVTSKNIASVLADKTKRADAVIAIRKARADKARADRAIRKAKADRAIRKARADRAKRKATRKKN